MAQVVNLRLPVAPPPQIITTHQIPRHQYKNTYSIPKRQLTNIRAASTSTSSQTWKSLSRSLDCNGRFTCLFSNNRRQEEARKALEGALGGKKPEFEKWNNEIQKREQAGGSGGNSGGGGWFGWRGWFGGSDGDHFWQETQQGCLALLGILAAYLIIAKGDVMLALIFNPLLFGLRGTRTGFAFLTSKVQRKMYPNGQNFSTPQQEVPVEVSAKDRVMGKWGSN